MLKCAVLLRGLERILANDTVVKNDVSQAGMQALLITLTLRHPEYVTS